MIFWLLVVAMILLVLVSILRPLFKRSEKIDDDERHIAALYLARISELESDVQTGLISSDQLQLIRQHLDREYQREITVQGKNSLAGKSFHHSARKWPLLMTIILFLPVAGISLYFWLGEPEMLKKLPQAELSDPVTHPAIADMIMQLKTRLENRPDDIEGWKTLAHSYMTLGQFHEAVTAFEHLYILAGDDPTVLVHYANALSKLNNGRLQGRSSDLIEKALALEPDHALGLLFAGLADAERGNYVKAIVYWKRLLPQVQNDEQATMQLERLIREAQEQVEYPGNNAEQDTAIKDLSKSAGKSVTVNIILDPGLTDKTKPDDILFIYARATGEISMPVAVVRKEVRDLPLEVTLNDTQSMSPQFKLSGFEKVNITARISKSGKVSPQSGDMTGFVNDVPVGSGHAAQIVINQQIP